MEGSISIAGVGFNIFTDRLKLPVTAIHQSAHRRFFLQGLSGDSTEAFDVYLTDTAPPETNRFKRVFNGNGSWAVYSDGSDYYIVDGSPGRASPAWIAHVYSRENRITIHCRPWIIDQAQNRLRFNILSYPLDQILLMNHLADHQGGIFHAAGWEYQHAGWIFAGKSGAGKSTIAGVIAAKGVGHMLSDDRIVLRKTGQRFLMYGTPWPGEAGYAVNRSVPLKGMFFLNQGEKNRIAEIKSSEALSLLLPVMSVPWYDREKVLNMMAFCESLLEHIPMHRLIFRPDASLMDALEGFIDG